MANINGYSARLHTKFTAEDNIIDIIKNSECKDVRVKGLWQIVKIGIAAPHGTIVTVDGVDIVLYRPDIYDAKMQNFISAWFKKTTEGTVETPLAPQMYGTLSLYGKNIHTLKIKDTTAYGQKVRFDNVRVNYICDYTA